MPKQPRAVLDGIFAFSPNRETLGATAYLIVENNANLLVDCPPWDESTQQFLQEWGGIRWLFLTHRGAIAHAKEIQQATGCDIIIQEQEAYLLPETTLTCFRDELTFGSNYHAIWTPGHSPGSACLHYPRHGGVLFTGRHLLPDSQGDPVPLRTSKTFHWLRQIRSVEALRDRFCPGVQYLCPGANTGFLRGKRTIDRPCDRLAALDLDALRDREAVL